jgi:signal transduction histidine kinase
MDACGSPAPKVVIDPGNIQDNAVTPPVVIEEVLVDGEAVFRNGAATTGSGPAVVQSPITGPPPPPDHSALRAPHPGLRIPDSALGTRHSALRLPPGRARFLVIHYTANSFISPHRLRFKHRLEGHDRDWIDSGTARAAHYTNLRPGHHRFRVMACNAHGRWNEAGASLALFFAPFFYQTWWFRFACAGTVVLALAVCYRWRVAQLRRFQALEKEQVLARERERIARELHDDIGAGLQQISLLSELAQRDARAESAHLAHVRQMGQTARDSLRTLSQAIWTLEPCSASLASFAAYVGDFAQRLLAPTGIRCHVEVPTAWPPAELSPPTRHQLLVAAKEALNNILKHAAATEVRLQFWINNGTFTMQIQDNGRGFALPTPHSAL